MKKRLQASLILTIATLMAIPCFAQSDGGKKKKKPVKTEQTTSANNKRKQEEARRQREVAARKQEEERLRLEAEAKRQQEENSKYNGYEFVDLGLPSGLKWAICNVGASSPSDYGNYYSWGETNSWSDYSDNDSETWAKNLDDIGGNVQYDAARANWGGTWRLPTKSELEELSTKCTWKWCVRDGHDGYLVTGPNSKSIFLPAAGHRFETSLYGAGSEGYYLSSTPYDSSERAYILSFDLDDGSHEVGGSRRYDGQSVRPVSE